MIEPVKALNFTVVNRMRHRTFSPLDFQIFVEKYAWTSSNQVTSDVADWRYSLSVGEIPFQSTSIGRLGGANHPVKAVLPLLNNLVWVCQQSVIGTNSFPWFANRCLSR
jgi:hypothetical protein